MINVMIVGKYKDAINKITDLFNNQSNQLHLVGTANNEQETMERVESFNPDVLIFALATKDNSLLSVAKRAYTLKPKISCVIYKDDVDIDLYKEAMDAGIKTIKKYPETMNEMETDIVNIYNIESQRLEYMTNTKGGAILYSSTVISVYGVKDGVGSSTIAINLAVEIAKKHKTVALVDLDSEFGDIAAYMHIEPKKTIADLFQDHEDFTINNIEDYMEMHFSGVHVLCAPKSSEYAEIITINKVNKLLNLLKKYYDFVILDVPAGLSSFHAEIFKSSNAVYTVMCGEVPMLNNIKNAVSVLNVLQLKKKIQIIMNKTSKLDAVQMKDVHNTVECRIIGKIPSDYKYAVAAINRGIPISTAYPKCSIKKEIENLAKYTISKNNDLDIWNMNDSKRQTEYNILSKPIAKLEKNKK